MSRKPRRDSRPRLSGRAQLAGASALLNSQVGTNSNKTFPEQLGIEALLATIKTAARLRPAGQPRAAVPTWFVVRAATPTRERNVPAWHVLLSSAHMRAAVIFGLGCSTKSLEPFQSIARKSSFQIDWRIGLPAASDRADVVLLFGGDGTIHRHLSQLAKLALPVLIVPAGSGNDFARALGMRGVRNSLNAWRRFCEHQNNVRVIDVGSISPLIEKAVAHSAAHGTTEHAQLSARYFCTVAGIGLSSEVARRANELPRWLRGHGGYALTVLPTVFRFAPIPTKISIPDAASSWTIRSNKPTILAAFANASTYGDGMKIAPQAKVDDGELDVCVIAGIDALKLFCMFPTVYSGRHLKITGVEYFRAERLRVETESPLDIYADGEFVCRTPVEISVHRAALKIVTP